MWKLKYQVSAENKVMIVGGSQNRNISNCAFLEEVTKDKSDAIFEIWRQRK